AIAPPKIRALVGASLAVAVVLASAPCQATGSAAFNAAKSCRKQMTNQGRNYYRKRFQLLLNCVDKLLKCEVLLEVDGTNPGQCRSSALDSCTARIGSASDSTLNKAITSFGDKVSLACLALDLSGMLSTGSGGLWYSNDGTCSGSADVPSLVACVRGE